MTARSGYGGCMFLVDLLCEAGHLFEGWYENAGAFAEARAAGELQCPTCGSDDVVQKPSFRGIALRAPRAPQRTRLREQMPALTTAGSTPVGPTLAGSTPDGSTPDGPTRGGRTSSPPSPPSMPLEVQRALSQLLRVVRAHSKDVGESFATRALAMHHGEEDAHPIHGSATADEQERLVEEGVPFASIPIPDIDQN